MRRTDELTEQGRELRRSTTPRSGLATGLDLDRDPVAILDAQNATRLPDLVPVRWARMSESPFAFYRGAAAVMAHDVAPSAATGIIVQACGDAHLANFGLYASPERALVFDLNDFDETAPAPWEWDVERLVASLAIAARSRDFGPDVERASARAAATAYQRTVRRAAGAAALSLFHAVVTEDALLGRSEAGTLLKTLQTQPGETRRTHDRDVTRAVERATRKARQRTSEQALTKLSVTADDGRPRIIEQPPLVVRIPITSDLLELPDLYRASVPPDIATLVTRFTPVDIALRVVGVGSVGTRCYVVLCIDSTGAPLILQEKEATASVLAPYTSGTVNPTPGERVVAGQRIMQSVSDPFLGWGELNGRHYYVRQFRDMKGGFDVARMSPSFLSDYAALCGIVLARAHCQSIEPALLSGYLGHSGAFATAMTRFAVAYADQNDRDYAALLEAIRSGRVTAASPA